VRCDGRLHGQRVFLVALSFLGGCVPVGPDHVRYDARPPALTDVYSYPSLIDSKAFTLGKDGALWIAEGDFGTLGARLHRVTSAGVMTDVHIPSFGCGPDAVAGGPDGSVWYTYTTPEDCYPVPDNKADYLGRVMPSGQIRLYKPPKASGGVEGVAVDIKGRVYVREYGTNKIAVRLQNGTFREYLIPGSKPTPLLQADGHGTVWFTDSAAIGNLTDAGTVTRYPLPRDCIDPVSLAIDHNLEPWIVSIPNKEPPRICHLNDARQILSVPVPKEVGWIGGLAEGPAGDVWFSAFNAVGRITRDGRVTTYPIPQSTFWWTAPPTTAGGPIITGGDGNLWLQTTVPGGTGFGEHLALGKFVVAAHNGVTSAR
jgi:virginiamycin B lyase